MEIDTGLASAPARAAATLVMLRDSDAGMQVFLLKRHGLSDVLGGSYVFPGGKVDLRDADLDMERHLDRPPAELLASLNESQLDLAGAASLYVAVLREAFEESGVLFAHGATRQQALEAGAMLRTGYAFDEVLAQKALRLDTGNVLPWSRWITPIVPTLANKRFDTRFFVSVFPARQVAQHDNHEATESVWLTPRDALKRYWDGELELAPPQIMSLAHLSHYASAQDVLLAARSRRPPVIAPERLEEAGSRLVCYPGDVCHSVRERALPGPTRLVYRNQRFEPVGGFDALFVPATGS